MNKTILIVSKILLTSIVFFVPYYIINTILKTNQINVTCNSRDASKETRMLKNNIKISDLYDGDYSNIASSEAVNIGIITKEKTQSFIKNNNNIYFYNLVDNGKYIIVDKIIPVSNNGIIKINISLLKSLDIYGNINNNQILFDMIIGDQNNHFKITETKIISTWFIPIIIILFILIICSISGIIFYNKYIYSKTK